MPIFKLFGNCNDQKVSGKDSGKSRTAVVFPKNRRTLEQLGENIKLARKRRGYTQKLMSGRLGVSRLTIRKIERGEPTVSIGHYVAMVNALGLADDFAKVALDDELGRKLQDIKLMNSKLMNRKAGTS